MSCLQYYFCLLFFDSDYQDISIVKTENIVPEIAIYSPGLSAEVDKYYNYEPKWLVQRRVTGFILEK